MAKINAKKYLRELTACQNHNGKDEDGHKQADELIAQMVNDLGFTGIAAAYRGVEKQYD